MVIPLIQRLVSHVTGAVCKEQLRRAEQRRDVWASIAVRLGRLVWDKNMQIRALTDELEKYRRAS